MNIININKVNAVEFSKSVSKTKLFKTKCNSKRTQKWQKVDRKGRENKKGTTGSQNSPLIRVRAGDKWIVG